MLTDLKCRSAKPAERTYKLPDGGGLALHVSPQGTKVFRYRYEKRQGGQVKESSITLGRYVAAPPGETPEEAQNRRNGGRLTLAEARQARDRARDLVAQGVDPVHRRRVERLKTAADQRQTVQAMMTEWVDSQVWEPATKNDAHSLMRRLVYPAIGQTPVVALESPEILHLLKKIHREAGYTPMKRARRYLWRAFEQAAESFIVRQNPVLQWRAALPSSPPPQHKRPLPIEEIGQLLREVDDYGGRIETISAFRLMWWTLCRSGEVAGARWEEIDLDNAVWRIPASRMKARREHTVPLPRQAVEMLRHMHLLNGRRDYVFAGQSRKTGKIGSSTLLCFVRHMGWEGRYSPHATRTTASTLLNELGYRPDVIESQLAHRDPDAVRRTYNHAQYWEERARMMQDWADMLDRWMAGET